MSKESHHHKHETDTQHIHKHEKIESPRKRDSHHKHETETQRIHKHETIESPRKRDKVESPRKRDSHHKHETQHIHKHETIESPRKRDKVESPRKRDSHHKHETETQHIHKHETIESPRKRDKVESPRKRDSHHKHETETQHIHKHETIESPRKRDSHHRKHETESQGYHHKSVSIESLQKGVPITGEQELDRRREAQAVLHRLQSIAAESETPGIDIISDILMRVENIFYQSSLQSNVDRDTRKTLEDIYALLVCTQQMTRNKGLSERIQRITIASQKSLDTFRSTESNSAMQHNAQEAIDFLYSWRPLFYLLIKSGDFRKFITDCIKIGIKITKREKDRKDDSSNSDKERKNSESLKTEWDNLNRDIQRVFLIMAREPSYREGLDNLFSLLSHFKRSLVGSNQAQTPILRETEELVSSFTGPEIIERFKDQLKQLIYTIQHNPSLKEYFMDLKTFILTTKSEEEVRTEDFKKKTRKMMFRGRNLMNQFAEKRVKSFLKTSQQLIQHFEDDNFIQILRHQAGIIRSDLTYVDDDGREQIDTQMISNLQHVLFPFLADALKYIPIPRIASSNSKQEFALDNIVMCIYDFLPENIFFHIESDSQVSLKQLALKTSHTHLIIELDKIITEIKDMEFYFKKKRRGLLPEVSDSGRVSVRFRKPGAKLRMIFTIIQDPNENFPKLIEGSAQFNIREMEIDLDKSTLNHDILLPMLQNMFKKRIQHNIERSIEHSLSKIVQQLAENILKALKTMNKRFVPSLDTARDMVKNSNMAQIIEKRRELIE